MLIRYSLVRHKDEELCRKGPRGSIFAILERRYRTILKKLVVNSSEETVFVYLIGTNRKLKVQM